MKPTKARKIAWKSRRIKGWFSREAVMLFAWIDEIQKRNGIRGDLFEIGCHHGKSAVLLGQMVDPEQEKLSVCDLFGSQGQNVSRSGSGDLETFDRNMRSIRDAGVAVNVFSQDSAELNVDNIGTGYRFFHIDGGHNADEALRDLRLAASVILDRGVIVLDDPFRHDWPGVTEALVHFLDEFEDFRAILVGFNKLVLAHKSAASLYAREFQSEGSCKDYRLGYPWYIKELPFHESQLLIFGLRARFTENKVALYLVNAIANLPWLGQSLLNVVARLGKPPILQTQMRDANSM